MTARNILYISESAVLGGAEISLLDIITSLDKEKSYPFFICSQDGPLAEKLRKEKISTDIIKLEKVRQVRFWRFLSSIKRLASFIKANKIDIIHANSTRANFLAGIAARFCSIPVVWHVRNLVAPGIYIDLEKYFTWLAQAIIVNSMATGKRFPKASKKTFVIYNGVDLDKFKVKVNADKLRREFNLNPQARIVAVVGRLGPGKGQDIFLRAATLVRKELDNVKYFIIGSACFPQDVHLENSLKSLAVSLGLGDDCLFTGFRPDMPDIMNSIDILVSPESITGQAFGRVLVEAMACAKPVIATDAGGAVEVVDRDITGILVPMRDVETLAAAIKLLVQDRELCAKMGQAGTKRVAELFNLKNTVKQIEDVYSRLLTEAGGGRLTA